ncbi:hypothetical protein MNV_480023 [Candidatus Methanoperedens nitroreducens]|uniref:Uncharacterized protein n=1 Tax=Candidatus Methanoperedens nitratireducens TaxID=1392998 RepID=A0A284VR96_9EURY|nr:hypothetical protein MNV_480023 [Candidatus Methanoperedens nitroreducens]
MYITVIIIYYFNFLQKDIYSLARTKIIAKCSDGCTPGSIEDYRASIDETKVQYGFKYTGQYIKPHELQDKAVPQEKVRGLLPGFRPHSAP